MTSYYVNLAADRLDLVLDLEADRMHNLLLDPKIIASEREVVTEERRTRTEDDPGGFLGEEVSATAFRAHPYGQPIIGWPPDLKRITPEEIRAFYRTYYVPNNALLVVVGDFKAADALAKVKTTFGAIPRGADPPPVLAVEPVQNGERRVTVEKSAQLPIVYLGYPVPNQKSADAAPLELLSVILAGGRSSRLYRTWCTSVSSPSRPAATTPTSPSTRTCSGSGPRRCPARRRRRSRRSCWATWSGSRKSRSASSSSGGPRTRSRPASCSRTIRSTAAARCWRASS